MKIEQIKEENEWFNLSFNNFDILEFCINFSMVEAEGNFDHFIYNAWWSLFEIDREEVLGDKNAEDTTLIITIDDETQIMTVKEVDERIMSSIEKLSKILHENKITFNRKMILFGDE